MADTPLMVHLTIDGQKVSVPKGTNVLEAAESIGIPISYFCYHPGLSSPAVCRQCLVEIKGQPKPVPSCYTPATDGMDVTTSSERILLVSQQMLEFTLVNHPVDCPICDKAGECTLQKLYMEWDGHDSRVDFEKVHKPKMVDVGPHIVLDAERCILCTRCIRVCDEVAKQHQLEMTYRGDHQILSTAPGEQLDNPYSINTVDVCPVGALTAKDFRFTMRAWELWATPSVCPGCATGCNIEVHHAQGLAWRNVPRLNEAVNKYWMCDEGRFTYKSLAQRRVVAATQHGDPAPLDKAVAFAAERLSMAREENKGIGVVFGAQCTNEDLYLAGKVAFDHLGEGVRAFVARRPERPERADDNLRDADVNPNTKGAWTFTRGKAGTLGDLEAALAAGQLAAVWFVGEDVELSDAALDALLHIDTIVQAVHDAPIELEPPAVEPAGAWLADPKRARLAAVAKVVLPAAAWAEVDGTFTNRQGRVQRIRRVLEPPGAAKPHWELVLAVARRMGAALQYANARTLFNEMKASVPEMAAAEWGRALPLTQLRFAGSRG